MTMAGMMKQVPAASTPRQPARAYPMWMAISVEFGPGIRLVAPTRSRKAWSVIQRRRRTTSSRIMAMCAAGPPNPKMPSRRKSAASSVRRPPAVRGSSVMAVVDFVLDAGGPRQGSPREGGDCPLLQGFSHPTGDLPPPSGEIHA